jgi:hypothetical protein
MLLWSQLTRFYLRSIARFQSTMYTLTLASNKDPIFFFLFSCMFNKSSCSKDVTFLFSFEAGVF